MPDPPGDAPVAAYVAAFLVYVAAGFFVKAVLLNWVVGPLFLVFVLDVVPHAWARLARSRRRRSRA